MMLFKILKFRPYLIVGLISAILGLGVGSIATWQLKPAQTVVNNDQRNQCPEIEKTEVEVPNADASLAGQEKANDTEKELAELKRKFTALQKENSNVRVEVVKVPQKCEPIVKVVRANCDSVHPDRVPILNRAVEIGNSNHN